MSFNLRLSSIVIRNVLRLEKNESVAVAADSMRERNVSSVVFFVGAEIYILSMEDVLGMIFEGRSLEVDLCDLGLPKAMILAESARVLDAFEQLTDSGLKYLAVVDEQGAFAGVVTYADLLGVVDPSAMTERKTVGELVSRRKPVVFTPDWILEDVLCHLLEIESAVVVVEDGFPVGILTAKDAFRIVRSAEAGTRTLAEHMTRPVLTVSHTSSLNDALNLLKRHGIKRVVVVDDGGRVSGLVTRSEIVKFAYGPMSQRHKALLESARAVPWEVDASIGVFTYVGRQVEHLLGWPQASWVTLQDWFSRIHPDDRTHAIESRLVLSPALHDHEADYRVRRSDGSFMWVRDVVRVLRKEGGIETVSGFMFDISDGKRLEFQLVKHHEELESLVQKRTLALSIAKEAADAANRAKSCFLANISHEVRTPMNTIVGMTELAVRQATDSVQRNRLEKVLTASRQLMKVFQDVMDVTRIESERLTLEHREFTLAGVMDQLQMDMQPLASAKGLSFDLDIEHEHLTIQLCGDPARLLQVLSNLVGNAIKFTSRGGVSVRASMLGSGTDTTDFCFDVVDTGIGIADHDLVRIFQPFEQVDSSSTRPYNGTGLGLTICRHLASLMGGDIRVKSRSSLGSTFSFTCRFARPDHDCAAVLARLAASRCAGAGRDLR